MNTKWEEELNQFYMKNADYEGLSYNQIKAFIKDQITEAEKRGYERGVNKMASFMGAEEHSKASSDMPECELCPNGTHKDYPAISEQSESLVKQAQQEIAEKIIEDIPENMPGCGCDEGKTLKDQLRKKYLNN